MLALYLGSFVGAVLVVAALGKSLSPAQAITFTTRLGLPHAIAVVAVLVVGVTETALGLAAMSDLGRLWVSGAVFVLVAGLTGAAVFARARRMSGPCGCFGLLDVQHATVISQIRSSVLMIAAGAFLISSFLATGAAPESDVRIAGILSGLIFVVGSALWSRVETIARLALRDEVSK